MKKSFKIFSCCFIAILVCFSYDLSAQKLKKKKNTFIRRSYHNITARYNGYFNASNKLNDGAKKLAQSHVDKYTMLLTINRLGDESKAKSVFGQMDEVIKKASIVIQRHEISKWVDDCYLLIGKANFYKRDYFTAIENFRYITSNYKNGNAKDEATLWIGRCYIELNKFGEAETVLDITSAAAKISNSFRSNLNAAYADLFIRSKNYPKAIEYLTKAVASTGNKDTRARYQYISAQLHELTGEPERASVAFEKVITMKPPYEMEFNARINSARLFQAKTKSSKREIEKQLVKLLRDDKNKDFRDQIYFALGNIEERDKNYAKAVEYYTKASQAASSNIMQKAESFLRVAKIYYHIETDYIKAQLYYDSTSTFISKDHVEYEDVINKKNSLAVLVKNMKIITTEDSLQHLASLPEKERLVIVEKLIRLKQEEERQRAEEERHQRESLLQTNLDNQANQNQNKNVGASWYFYNTAAISSGYSEFLKKFGQRKLEDNWRRSNKETFSTDATKEEGGDDAEGDENKITSTEKLRKQLLSAIPTTAGQFEASNTKLIGAYFELGNFYKEKIIDPGKSAYYFDQLLNRFPNNNYKLECYYNLYRNYINQNNAAKAEEYKNILLNEYPTSVFANIIRNPNYLKDANSPENKLQQYYEDTYNAYMSNNCGFVMQRCGESAQLFPNNFLSAKFDYLHALCTGKTGSEDEFIKALDALARKYPGDEVSVKARQTIEQLNKKQKAAMQPDAEITSLYKVEEGKPFFFIFCTDGGANLNQTKSLISDFNRDYFELNNLRTDAQFLNEKQQMIVVKSFPDKSQAMNYYQTFNQNANSATNIEKDKYSACFLSSGNFVVLLKDKNIESYLQFFQKNYLIE